MTVPKQQRLFSIERRGQPAANATGPRGANSDVPALAVGEDGLERILSELAELRAEVAALHGDKDRIADDDAGMKRDVRIEVAQMVRCIGRAKTEIAAIKNPAVGHDEMQKASLQLEEITKATENATNEIMSATDDVEQILKKIHAHTVEDADVSPLLDEAGERLIAIIEACAFQDLTGQRITQVIKTLRFIESRVLAMIDIWGLEAFSDLEIPDDEMTEGAAASDGDEGLLNGPALGGQGLSQADIDALFD